ncbi:hypothetical [Yersinia pestis KIM10+]|uniref:Uncharacterized protein n=1 Tax=Yersinia pestis TaxID=632 RepID=Q8CLA1_YERPE|nr:hypothetical [Yersinia pestis KIM10+]
MPLHRLHCLLDSYGECALIRRAVTLNYNTS